MRLLIKNFSKLNLRKTIQAVVFIVFIVLFSALSMGIVATPLQLLAKSGNVVNNSKKWDYNWLINWNRYSSKFVYTYFEDESDNLYNEANEKLLNLDYKLPDSENNLQTDLNLYYSNHKDEYPDFESFIGKFIVDNIFYSQFTFKNHSIIVPSDSAKEKLYPYEKIVNPYWQKQSDNIFGQVFVNINNDLLKKFGSKSIFDFDFALHYDWGDFTHDKLQYNLSGISKNLSDNVVLNHSQNFDLDKLKDDEILVNDRFAKERNIKIGDEIKIHDFVDSQGNKVDFNDTYKVVAFALRPDDLFARNIFNSDTRAEPYFYLKDSELSRYVRYFYKNDEHFYIPNRSSLMNARVNYFTRWRTYGSEDTKAFISDVEKNHVLKREVELVKYSDLGFSLNLVSYKILSGIFISLSLIVFIFSVLFIGFSFAKEIEMYKEQIFILKAMGYSSMKISFVWWIRTLVILLIGFWIGWLLSFELQVLVNQMMMVNANFTIDKIWFNVYFLLTVLLFVPLLLSLINYGYLANLISKKNLVTSKQKKVHHNHLSEDVQGLKVHLLETKMFYQIKKHDKLITVKKATQGVFLFLITIIFEVLMILEFGSKQFFRLMIDQVNPIYNSQIDSKFSLDSKFNWIVNGGSFSYEKNGLELNVFSYDSSESLNKVVLNKQTIIMEKLIEAYLNVDRNRTLPEVSAELIPLLIAINSIDINHASFQINSVEQFLKVFLNDCQRFETILNLKADSFSKIYKKLTAMKIKFEEYENYLANKEMFVSINNLFIEKDVDFPVVSMKLFNQTYDWNSGMDWKLILLNSDNKFIFKQDLNRIENLPIDENNVPVIITKHFSVLNNSKVGDIIREIPISTDAKKSKINLVVADINDDTVSNNFYAYEANWIKHSKQKLIPNEVYTKKKIISNAKVTSDYFNFIYKDIRENGDLYLFDLFDQTPINFVSPGSFNTDNFASLTIEKQLEKDKSNSFRNLMNCIVIISSLLILILFLVYSFIGVNNNFDKIYALKALGYKDFEIANYINADYFLIFFLSIIISSLIVKGIWSLATKGLLKSGARMVIDLKFDFLEILYPSIIIGGIFLTGYLLTFIIIKNSLKRQAN